MHWVMGLHAVQMLVYYMFLFYLNTRVNWIQHSSRALDSASPNFTIVSNLAIRKYPDSTLLCNLAYLTAAKQ